MEFLTISIILDWNIQKNELSKYLNIYCIKMIYWWFMDCSKFLFEPEVFEFKANSTPSSYSRLFIRLDLDSPENRLDNKNHFDRRKALNQLSWWHLWPSWRSIWRIFISKETNFKLIYYFYYILHQTMIPLIWQYFVLQNSLFLGTLFIANDLSVTVFFYELIGFSN